MLMDSHGPDVEHPLLYTNLPLGATSDPARRDTCVGVSFQIYTCHLQFWHRGDGRERGSCVLNALGTFSALPKGTVVEPPLLWGVSRAALRL